MQVIQLELFKTGLYARIRNWIYCHPSKWDIVGLIDLSLIELRQICLSCGVPVSGSKFRLVGRLIGFRAGMIVLLNSSLESISSLSGKKLKKIISLLPGKVWRSAPTKAAMASVIINWHKRCVNNFRSARVI